MAGCVRRFVPHADLWFDGACSGNPGPMGAGALVIVDGKRFEVSSGPGRGTNNEAEYLGLIGGLRKALTEGATTVTIQGDSQLILRQLEGKYAVRAANLRPFYQEALGLLRKFSGYDLLWIPREENEDADRLARLGAGQR